MLASDAQPNPSYFLSSRDGIDRSCHFERSADSSTPSHSPEMSNGMTCYGR